MYMNSQRTGLSRWWPSWRTLTSSTPVSRRRPGAHPRHRTPLAVERLEDRQMLSATMLGGSGQSQSQSQSQGQSQFQSQSQSQSVSVSQSQSQSQGQSQSQSIQVSNSQSSGPQTFQGSLVFTSLKVSTSGAVATV